MKNLSVLIISALLIYGNTDDGKEGNGLGNKIQISGGAEANGGNYVGTMSLAGGAEANKTGNRF